MIGYGGQRILSLHSPLGTQALPPLEVFVLRIVLGEPREDQVHGVVEVVRNDRRCTFHNFEELLQLLRRELESARLGAPGPSRQALQTAQRCGQLALRLHSATNGRSVAQFAATRKGPRILWTGEYRA